MKSSPKALTGTLFNPGGPIPPAHQESYLYTRSYFAMRKRSEQQRLKAYQQEFQRLAARCSGNYVLDYGCGDGSFLDHFYGWQRYGVEVSEYCLEVCTQKGICMVETDDLIDGSFDLVVFRGVLQHLDNPFEALREAARLLREGGMIAILAQPDADSLCYRLFGDLPALDPPRNWWIPGRRELANILGKLGFRDIEALHPYWGGPYANPPRDFLRFAMRLVGVRRPFPFPGNMMELYARAVKSTGKGSL